jgi:hypothetical protein
MCLDTQRAICHEGGHAIIALHFGFSVQQIAIAHRRPYLLTSDLDSPQRTAQERYIFLAGGIASEISCYGHYDQEGMRLDQKMICERGGGPIENYVPDALKIIRSNEACLTRLRGELTARWVAAAAEAAFESDPDTFELISRQELKNIWQKA